MRETVLVDLLDEVAEHLLSHVEVGDDTVLERPDRGDRARRAAEHALRLDADRMHLARALVDRDHRRLGEHDAAPAHVHERVRSTEVHGHVAAIEATEVVEEAHPSSESSLETGNKRSERVIGRARKARPAAWSAPQAAPRRKIELARTLRNPEWDTSRDCRETCPGPGPGHVRINRIRTYLQSDLRADARAASPEVRQRSG